MMPQQIQQPEPPSKFNIIMEKFAWPTITLTVGTVLAAVIIAIWLGKIQILDFNWLMLILGVIMLGITISFVWYSLRIRRILQDKYLEDITAIRNDNRAFKDEFRQYYKEELERSHQFEINFAHIAAKEHKEHSAELKRQCMEAISDAEQMFDSTVKATQ